MTDTITLLVKRCYREKTEKQPICREEGRKETIKGNKKEQKYISNKNKRNTDAIVIKTK